MSDLLDLPPDRDLPPAAHDRIRSELLRAVAGPGPARSVRWYAPAAVALATLTVLAVAMSSTWLPSAAESGHPAEGVRPRVAPVYSTGGGPAVYTARPEPALTAIPGLDPADAARIEEECRQTLRMRTSTGRLRLYNALLTPGGYVAILFDGHHPVSCQSPGVDGAVAQTDSFGRAQQHFGWLVSKMDEGGWPFTPRDGASYVLVAEVRRDIVRVRVHGLTRDVDVPVVNGTILSTAVGAPGFSTTPWKNLTGYDQQGRVVATDKDGSRYPCVATPDGRIISGDFSGRPEWCDEAYPWW
ncbi:hypothetical protein Lfu02_23400 [Longispora fulva]|uniref:Uncharacterized protein n=1 Tax=Longispora fulva TaxID=619741 RepID=A0A8J7KIT6_9ACTN|nr:hypothetical protein [Longispora fulva]MBG6139650.1 hypothetical protein [Longispora fulva]GIG57968.1 hypothetical protein Lfu02_23400 [Longispora fulva]